MPAPQPQTLTARNVRNYVQTRLGQTDDAGKPVLTAAALARALGMSKYALNRRLWHDLPFTFDEVVRLADYFHTSTDDLRGVTPTRSKANG